VIIFTLIGSQTTSDSSQPRFEAKLNSPASREITRSGKSARWRRIIREDALKKYKQISDYGLIGDLKTCALVGIDGSIDWFCIPRFDSPSVFGSLLDVKKGGRFLVMPTDEEFDSYQHYDGPTNILVTEFRTKAGGLAGLTDFMPCFKVANTMVSSGEIHRRLGCLEGELEMEIFIKPRFNYGGVIPKVEYLDHRGYTFYAQSREIRQELALLTPLKLEEVDEATLSLAVKMKKGDQLDLVVRYGGAKLHHRENAYTEIKLRETRTFWTDWIEKCTYEGKWKNEVLRSALSLRLLVYSGTGAIIAAPTTSLPEEIGGVRNWDYRYSWIRDSTFVLWALHSLGHNEEAQKYMNWLLSIFYLTGGNLQVMLGVSGERDLSEISLGHLEGYKDSAPVRVGNGAWDQFQLDVYGILLDAMYFTHKHGGGLGRKVYEHLVKEIMDALKEDWKKPDCGIWEVRGERKHFVYSKMWCWVAADRAVKIARAHGQTEDAREFAKLRDEIKAEIFKNGWSDSLNSFVRSYGSEELDSANLLMPQVRFINPKDPRMIATIDRTMEKLLEHGKYLYRYLTEDGLPGREGAFLICSFWLVNCLTMAGRLEEAEKLMDELVRNSNHLGLFSEEIDPRDSTMLGNFPQAFTHMGFVTAATALGRALRDKGKG